MIQVRNNVGILLVLSVTLALILVFMTVALAWNKWSPETKTVGTTNTVGVYIRNSRRGSPVHSEMDISNTDAGRRGSKDASHSISTREFYQILVPAIFYVIVALVIFYSFFIGREVYYDDAYDEYYDSGTDFARCLLTNWQDTAVCGDVPEKKPPEESVMWAAVSVYGHPIFIGTFYCAVVFVNKLFPNLVHGSKEKFNTVAAFDEPVEIGEAGTVNKGAIEMLSIEDI